MKTKVLLINLGTPKSTKLIDVARYLHEFLMDPKVIDVPWLARKALVGGVIVPLRTIKSARAYKKIWTNNGSPLLINSQAIADNLQQILGLNYEVKLAMRYGMPSIKNTLKDLLATPIQELIVIPLFPQYSSAANGSAIAQFYKCISAYSSLKIRVVNQWYNNPTYIELIANSIKEHLTNDTHLIISFHGIPVRQNVLACNQKCNKVCSNSCNFDAPCYQTQCNITAQLIAQYLNLSEKNWSLAFQSRIGKIEWLKPYLNEHIVDLYQHGFRKICVVSPGFVADCLETIEELGMRLQQDWYALGGTSFKLIPCLNQENALIIASLVKTAKSIIEI